MNVFEGFSREQRGVAVRMASTVGVAVLVAALSLHGGADVPSTLRQRLSIAVKADLFILCWLVVAIGNVARLRFCSHEDIAGCADGTASARVGRARAVLQNTLEQVALAMPVYVALALLLTSSMVLIIALLGLFAIGRLLFWVGREVQKRALSASP